MENPGLNVIMLVVLVAFALSNLAADANTIVQEDVKSATNNIKDEVNMIYSKYERKMRYKF